MTCAIVTDGAHRRCARDHGAFGGFGAEKGMSGNPRFVTRSIPPVELGEVTVKCTMRGENGHQLGI